ncbi:MAG: DUF2058 domain-containing protein [Gammaproteobacteria bacterium]|nr:DUF2058 domain-containing protein [Gammaproteobacteria bacterium]
MASLQEQLLKAGLANKQNAKQIRSEKRKKNKAVRKGQASAETGLQEQLKAQKSEQADKDLALNKDIKASLDHKAELAKVKQMLTQLQIKDFAGELAFNYVQQSKVKTLYVNDVNQNALIKGRIGICVFEQTIYLIAAKAIEIIKSVDQKYVLLLNDNQPVEVDEEDPYADFEIPDDLMW